MKPIHFFSASHFAIRGQLYRQQVVCEQEGVPFQSKIELMEATIRSFELVAGTRTHVLLDSWYCAKCLWRAARERDFEITTSMKSNRWLRIEDATQPRGWRWQRLPDYAASLDKSAFVERKWPRGGKTVYVHVVTTWVRTLCSCQVVIVRQELISRRFRRPATSPPAIWRLMLRRCWGISPPAGTLRSSSVMARRNWDWITLKS